LSRTASLSPVLGDASVHKARWDRDKKQKGLESRALDSAAQEAIMTSTTTESASGARGYRAESHGLILFASVLLVIIAVDVVALYGLCAYGSRENLTA
jgi:hypothetical protein